MERDAEFFTVTDETGKEIECEIILTFDSDEFNKSYVVYQIVDDESGEYYAASFNPEDGDEGKLQGVESDAEWDLIEEVLENFLEDEEDAEDGDDDNEAEPDKE